MRLLKWRVTWNNNDSFRLQRPYRVHISTKKCIYQMKSLKRVTIQSNNNEQRNPLPGIFLITFSLTPAPGIFLYCFKLFFNIFLQFYDEFPKIIWRFYTNVRNQTFLKLQDITESLIYSVVYDWYNIYLFLIQEQI